jgi:hypothetical protein
VHGCVCGTQQTARSQRLSACHAQPTHEHTHAACGHRSQRSPLTTSPHHACRPCWVCKRWVWSGGGAERRVGVCPWQLKATLLRTHGPAGARALTLSRRTRPLPWLPPAWRPAAHRSGPCAPWLARVCVRVRVRVCVRVWVWRCVRVWMGCRREPWCWSRGWCLHWPAQRTAQIGAGGGWV